MLRVFPVPTGESVSDDYEVRLNGILVNCYRCRVSAMSFNRPWPGHERPLNQTELSTFVSCKPPTLVPIILSLSNPILDKKF